LGCRSRGKIKRVALESTGVYWVPTYEILEAGGIEVKLINGAHAKNFPGRKSDVEDSEWFLQLESYGLLKASYIPEEKTRRLRSYVRLREDYHKEASTRSTAYAESV
jgi:transposase